MEGRSEVERMGWSPRSWERNVLLVVPPSREREFHCCVGLLTPDDPENLNVWSLGITLSPEERLRIWEARSDASPREFYIVSGQPRPRGTTANRVGEFDFDPAPRFASLKDPKNLTKLGVELTRSLEAWKGDGYQTVACFHSITALLKHVSTERAYQFLYPFTNAVREFDARAHYHVNPRVHEDHEIELLSTLFDGVVELGEE